jgi:hypothetical protein
MKKMKFLKTTLLCALGAMSISSCVKQDFDTPPDSGSIDPYLPITAPISAVAEGALYLESNKGRVLGDTTICGIVIGDDRSGNIYKQLYIQDTAGGAIALVLDRTNLYGDYPVGRKIYVKLKGLYLINYRGLPEIAYSIDATGSTTGIPSSLVSTYIVRGPFPRTITPKVVTIADLFSNPSRYLNNLVTIENMQFATGSNNVLYSNANSSTNRTISDCPFSGSLTMYNSSYSTFQAATTPNGKGKITGIFTTYYNTPQFVMRDTTDVRFTDPRSCP